MRRPARPNVLGVFVKAPVAGRVKTRLAAEIGPLRATALYRRLGSQVVRALAGEEFETVVWYAPRRDGRLVRAWLKGLGVSRFRAQSGGDLGNRLRGAFATHFCEGARRVVVIGSDCPGVDRRVIEEAFAALDAHDVVLGPARDGGYYLIGMKALHELLFRGIHWSSRSVLAETQTVVGALGLSCFSLRPLRDVDTVTDARALGLMEDSCRQSA
ncbi:MAG: TIGR04282 family arsenosugar biosynthesis glycosyltransferase [Gemmatimonadales bacterium]